MLDTKKILQLGIGVAVGMIAYHFIQKAMNGASSNGETAGAGGRFKWGDGICQGYCQNAGGWGTTLINYPCSQTLEQACRLKTGGLPSTPDQI